MDPNTEIRKLRPAELYTLARILAASDSWKTLMAVVPKEGTDNDPKFNTEHFALIEQASCQQQKSGAEIFLEEWSTMGKQRPTLKSTLDLLVRVDLFRAADYIAVDLLQKQPPARPTCGPAAPIDISDEEIAKLLQRTSSEYELSDSQIRNPVESLDSVLNGIRYPSQLSTHNSVEHRQQVDHDYQPETQCMGVDCVNQMSILRIYPEEIEQNNSNLMQFSKSDAEHLQNSHNSNLIQFSSGSIRSIKAMDLKTNSASVNSSEDSQFVLRRQNIVCTSSPNNFTGESNVSLKENNVQASYSSGTKAVLESECFSDTVNCNELELQTSELPAFVADLGRGLTTTYSELKSSELPQFVVEMTYQRSSQSNSQFNTESVSEPSLLTNANSSNNSSSSSNNITSSSDNNSESNIPICVNFNSGILGGNELVSAELPQFVADLGHRQNIDSSSSNEHFAGKFDDGNMSTDQYVPLASQELPLVISECNKMQSQGESNRTELQSAELPQFVAEL